METNKGKQCEPCGLPPRDVNDIARHLLAVLFAAVHDRSRTPTGCGVLVYRIPLAKKYIWKVYRLDLVHAQRLSGSMTILLIHAAIGGGTRCDAYRISTSAPCSLDNQTIADDDE
ncbi:hypothetical protein KCU85_g475, partial [Aureobasidium melanogenum]